MKINCPVSYIDITLKNLSIEPHSDRVKWTEFRATEPSIAKGLEINLK